MPTSVDFSLVAQMVKNLPKRWETQVYSLGWEDPLEKGMVPTPVFCLENSMDIGVWWATFMASQRVRHD